jgi:PAS domain S-box-containing protein
MTATMVRAVPTGVERTFQPDEIIVSKTDTHGKIMYANDVFLRVSGYEEHEVIGQPHSIIRHPDMPRAVFKLLWETLTAGRELFAYIDNLASNGDHYWVLAHVTPSRDRAGRIIGYHSNRRVPERRAVLAAEELYRQLRDVERRSPDRRDGLVASSAMLDSILASAGKPYEEWVWTL